MMLDENQGYLICVDVSRKLYNFSTFRKIHHFTVIQYCYGFECEFGKVFEMQECLSSLLFF